LWGVPQPVRYHSEIDAGAHTMLVVDYAARKGFSLPIRVSALLHDLGKGTTPPSQWPHHHAHEARSVQLVESVSRRLKVPNAIRDLAVMAAREHGNIRRGKEMRANTVVSLLERCDAFRKPQRFLDMISVAESDMRGRGAGDAINEDEPFEQRDFWQTALEAARGVDAGKIAQTCCTGKGGIPDAIHKARVEAVTVAVKADSRP
jgi:tRNA nucleotidyltransferase (CCA-adding enzyme)